MSETPKADADLLAELIANGRRIMDSLTPAEREAHERRMAEYRAERREP